MEKKNIDVLKGIKPFFEFKNNPAELRKMKLDPNDGDYLATFEDVLKKLCKSFIQKKPKEKNK